MLPIVSALAGPRPMAVADLDALRWPGAFSLAPDGRVAYEVTATDVEDDTLVTKLALARVDGGPARPLTWGDTSEGTPRFSPDGRWLGFLSDRGEDGVTQLWLLPMDGGEARAVTEAEGGIVDYAWAPDGARIALVVTDPPPESAEDELPDPIVVDRFWFKLDGAGYLGAQHQHLAVLDVASREVTPLTSGATDEHLPAFSPDGQRIAFVSKRGAPDPDRTFDWNVFVVEARAGAEPVRVTTNPGADDDPDWGSAPAWSPDGRHLAVVAAGDPALLYYAGVAVTVVAADGSGEAVPAVPGLDRNTWSPRFSPDGKALWFLVEDDLTLRVGRVALDGKGLPKGPLTRETAAEVAAEGFELGRGGDLVVRASSPDHPTELHALRKGALAPITEENRWSSGVAFARTRPVSWTSADGTEIHGLLHLPAGDAPGPFPLYLRLHGGPVSQVDPSFHEEAQLFAAHGWAVLRPNPRGSSGRGEGFAKAIFADWGNLDSQDVLAGVDRMIADGVADPERLAVGGWSYGGILTDQVISRDQRFDAAISGAGLADAFAGYGTDMYVREYEAELGAPWRDPAIWARNSHPLLHADAITTPTLFLCGQDDQNVPLHGSEQLYQALRSLGVPTRLVIYPGETHGIERPSFVRERMVRYLDWLDTYAPPR